MIITKATECWEKYIRDARRLLKPPEVILHIIPRWLSKRITAYRKKHNIYSASGCKQTDFQNVCCHILHQIGIDPYACTWLDHWGTSKGGPYGCCKDCFVSEPYGFDFTKAKIIEALCQALDLTWHVSSDTYWYPGRTVRITIHEKASEK